jgi:hypothetical protein
VVEEDGRERAAAGRLPEERVERELAALDDNVRGRLGRPGIRLERSADGSADRENHVKDRLPHAHRRGRNSIVASRLRRLRNPLTNFADPGVSYFSA